MGKIYNLTLLRFIRKTKPRLKTHLSLLRLNLFIHWYGIIPTERANLISSSKITRPTKFFFKLRSANLRVQQFLSSVS